jgi:hypothetical protein
LAKRTHVGRLADQTCRAARRITELAAGTAASSSNAVAGSAAAKPALLLIEETPPAPEYTLMQVGIRRLFVRVCMQT